MSIDYTNVELVKGVVPADGAIANATVVLNRSLTWTRGQATRVIGLSVYIITAATSATQTVRLQRSDAAGSFASAVDLATITIASTDAAGTVKSAEVDVADSILEPGMVLRVVHVATSTDASLVYGYEVNVAPRHY